MLSSHAENTSVDFDSSHKIIGELVGLLQHGFKADTHYKHPLIPPQANIIFALDGDVAGNMVSYMSAKLKDVGGFLEGEFRFTRKTNAQEGGIQRVRLEFTKGITTAIMRKIVLATDELRKLY